MSAFKNGHPTRYVSDAWLAAYYGVSRATIWRWTKAGRLPSPEKLSPGCTRWDLRKIESGISG